jgi:hypothetical protein
MDDRGQPEAGARPLSPLIEDRHTRLAVFIQPPLGRHLDERRLEHAITEVERVRTCIEDAVRRRAPARRLCTDRRRPLNRLAIERRG